MHKPKKIELLVTQIRFPIVRGKVRAPSEDYRVEQQIRAGGNADVGTETSGMIYTGVEMEVVRVNDVGCDHTSDRRSRRRRKTVWRRLAKSMAKVAYR